MAGRDKTSPQRFTPEEILQTIFEGTTKVAVIPLPERILSHIFKRAARSKSVTLRLNTLMEASDKLIARGMREEDATYLRERLKKIMEHRAASIAREYRMARSNGQKAGHVLIQDYLSSAHYYLGYEPIKPHFVIKPTMRSVVAARYQFGREIEAYMDDHPDSFFIGTPKPKPVRVPNIRPSRR